MEQEFFAAVTALFPLLVLTKSGARHRRQSHTDGDHGQLLHQFFILIAVVGEAFALAGAATQDPTMLVEAVVIVTLCVCGLIFAGELLRND
jgi:hypothetical protein